MKLQTGVEVGISPIGISLSDRICILGSCFADNMGEKMRQRGFSVCVNPFGTLYNPVSVFNAVERLSTGEKFTENDCVEMGSGAGLTCSFSHHTKAARKTKEEFLRDANASLEAASAFWRKCNKVVITFGSAWVYSYKATGFIVSNCLKRPAEEFVRERLSKESIFDRLERISAANPDKEFFLTVSPIRHLSDGAFGNSLSKASLLLAVSELCTAYPLRCVYFPAFEIMIDELRDYRFYAEDMVHPSQQAVDYIWERFCEFAMDPKEKNAMEDAYKKYRRSLHRDILLQEQKDLIDFL